MTFDDHVELALVMACEELEMTRDEAIRFFIREWLEGYGFLPVPDSDDRSETQGSAQLGYSLRRPRGAKGQ
ncbi:hypothetical protein AU381_08930 [Sinorhizobium glycinis]|uniref:Ribbon-helix-helix protein CopG domain-containing protein n=1 Tax=Sinorhizobium glycinis TaxID=1472378 RepID=A0A178Y823_9HYPH|nr:hypothetical protein [Sinorhizobium glycinis]OAP43504.1 hypothetical protein AU381_08930 [Sinorhizobium glycinis]